MSTHSPLFLAEFFWYLLLSPYNVRDCHTQSYMSSDGRLLTGVGKIYFDVLWKAGFHCTLCLRMLPASKQFSLLSPTIHFGMVCTSPPCFTDEGELAPYIMLRPLRPKKIKKGSY